MEHGPPQVGGAGSRLRLGPEHELRALLVRRVRELRLGPAGRVHRHGQVRIGGLMVLEHVAAVGQAPVEPDDVRADVPRQAGDQAHFSASFVSSAMASPTSRARSCAASSSHFARPWPWCRYSSFSCWRSAYGAEYATTASPLWSTDTYPDALRSPERVVGSSGTVSFAAFRSSCAPAVAMLLRRFSSFSA